MESMGFCLGSAPVSGAGESVPLSRTCWEKRFGETPKPTSETDVLPRLDQLFLEHVRFYRAFFDRMLELHVVEPAIMTRFLQ